MRILERIITCPHSLRAELEGSFCRASWQELLKRQEQLVVGLVARYRLPPAIRVDSLIGDRDCYPIAIERIVDRVSPQRKLERFRHRDVTWGQGDRRGGGQSVSTIVVIRD